VALNPGRQATHPEPVTSAIGSALQVVGDQWILVILQRAFTFHARRFAQWRHLLGISEPVLAGRLADMVESGLLVTVPYETSGRPRVEYRLTEKAIDLWSLLVAMYGWQQRWALEPKDPARLWHESCGSHVGVVFGCGNCDTCSLTTGDVEADLDEAEIFGRAAVPRRYRRHARPEASDAQRRAKSNYYYYETMEILGDRWNTLLVVAAFLRVRRFAELQRKLSIAPSVLTDRLQRLVQLDVLTRVPDPAGSAYEEYRLTEKGFDLLPVYAFVVEWANTWYAHSDDDRFVITHRKRGHQLRPALFCDSCGVQFTRTSVRFGATEPTP
jgi:DNA-binding HxlR family transcriptional regulator